MQTLRIIMLLGTLAAGYALFFSTQPRPGQAVADPALAGKPGTAQAAAHSQYKEAMDKANAVAKQMQAQRSEAYAY